MDVASVFGGILEGQGILMTCAQQAHRYIVQRSMNAMMPWCRPAAMRTITPFLQGNTMVFRTNVVV
jgi:hypothetical protein